MTRKDAVRCKGCCCAHPPGSWRVRTQHRRRRQEPNPRPASPCCRCFPAHSQEASSTFRTASRTCASSPSAGRPHATSLHASCTCTSRSTNSAGSGWARGTGRCPAVRRCTLLAQLPTVGPSSMGRTRRSRTSFSGASENLGREGSRADVHVLDDHQRGDLRQQNFLRDEAQVEDRLVERSAPLTLATLCGAQLRPVDEPIRTDRVYDEALLIRPSGDVVVACTCHGSRGRFGPAAARRRTGTAYPADFEPSGGSPGCRPHPVNLLR